MIDIDDMLRRGVGTVGEWMHWYVAGGINQKCVVGQIILDLMSFATRLVVAGLLLLSLLALVSTQEPKLIYVQEVFRHGHRYPIYASKYDNSSFINDIHSSGQLTKQGKSMHYILGQNLYKMYWGQLFANTPFASTYNQSKFYVKSTNVNRTIESVQSQMMGIFQNLDSLTIDQRDVEYSLPQWPGVTRQPGNVFASAPKFNPFPVHVQKGYLSPWDKGDFLRTYSGEFCPNQNKWMEQNKQNSFVKEIISDRSFQQAIARVNAALKTHLTFWDIYKYYDNAVCMTYEGRQVNPVWTSPGASKNALDAIFVLDMYLKLYYSEKQLKATATGYFNETYYHFKRVTADQSGVQWAFYSAHDTTVGNFLARLNLTNPTCIYENYKKGINKNYQTETCIVQYPAYTSNLIFQVYKYRNGTSTFKIRYNGEVRKIPFCDWQYECNVERYYKWFESWQDADYVTTCGVVNDQANKSSTLFTVAVLEGGLIICFLIAYLYRHLEKQHEKDDEKLINQIEKEIETSAQNQARNDVERSLHESLVTDG